MTDEGTSDGLDGPIITRKLDRRPERASDYEAENKPLPRLAAKLAERPTDVLQTLTETIVTMGIVDAAGISFPLTDGGKQRFC